MTEADIQEMRSRIAELEKSDVDFARKSNLLLDEILLTRDQADSNARAIENFLQASAEGRRDIDQLADRMGELATEVSDLRQATSELRESVEVVNQARREDIQVMVNIVDTLSASIRDLRETQLVMIQQGTADRAAWQAEIQRIWEYLMTTRSNGRGDLGGGQ